MKRDVGREVMVGGELRVRLGMLRVERDEVLVLVRDEVEEAREEREKEEEEEESPMLSSERQSSL